MIITRLLGGLGNQMFQYAAGLALAVARRTVLKLDVSWFREHAEFEPHNRYALDCFNVSGQFATEEEIGRVRGVPLTRTERWSVAIAEALRLYQYSRRYASAGNRYSPPSSRFDAAMHRQPDNTYLEGMYQSERYFAPIADTLRLHFSFRYPPTPEVAAIAGRIRQGPSAAIHFRRGDYVRNRIFSSEIGVLDMDYYDRAVRLLRERHPEAKLYVFSDDIEAVAREFAPAGPHEFVRCVAPWHAYDKIRLMSLCRHAVISNSTFAWWAAWLNASPDKLVVAPDPWFSGGPNDGSDVVPDTWIRLARAR